MREKSARKVGVDECGNENEVDDDGDGVESVHLFEAHVDTELSSVGEEDGDHGEFFHDIFEFGDERTEDDLEVEADDEDEADARHFEGGRARDEGDDGSEANAAESGDEFVPKHAGAIARAQNLQYGHGGGLVDAAAEYEEKRGEDERDDAEVEDDAENGQRFQALPLGRVAAQPWLRLQKGRERVGGAVEHGKRAVGDAEQEPPMNEENGRNALVHQAVLAGLHAIEAHAARGGRVRRSKQKVVVGDAGRVMRVETFSGAWPCASSCSSYPSYPSSSTSSSTSSPLPFRFRCCWMMRTCAIDEMVVDIVLFLYQLTPHHLHRHTRRHCRYS